MSCPNCSYKDYLLTEYKKQKRKLEPTEAKKYLTSQLHRGRVYSRIQVYNIKSPVVLERKQLKKQINHLLELYDDTDILKAIIKVLEHNITSENAPEA